MFAKQQPEARDPVAECLKIESYLIAHLKPLVEEAIGATVRLESAAKQGNLNYSFLVFPEKENFPCWIIKVKDSTIPEHTFLGPSEEVFRKEKIIWEAARGRGILSPQSVGPIWNIDKKTGNHGPFCASLRTYLKGRDGHTIAKHGSEEELPLLKEIGKMARPLAHVRLRGFGDMPIEGQAQFGRSWPEHVDKLAQSASQGSQVLGTSLMSSLIGRIESLKRLETSPILVHADLHPSNALFNALGQGEALIDWERGCASIIEEEFARVLYENFVLGQRFTQQGAIRNFLITDGITPQFAAFLEGYGLTPHQYQIKHRSATESLLALLCAGFNVNYHRKWYKTRPDWAVPANYAREAAEAILAKSSQD